MKLAQYLARSGLGSRRKMESVVTSGRVTVNGTVCVDQSKEVGSGQVALDGKPVTPAQLVYFAWHKPKGVTTTFSDSHAETTLTEALPKEITTYPVFAVGRLDRETEGLLLLTTDGEWAESIIHPRNATEKVYRALIRGTVPEKTLEMLRGGVELSDGVINPKKVVEDGFSDTDEWLEITVTEGRNRIIRRLIEAVGLDLLRLVRTKIADIELGDLAPTQFRSITPKKS
jgi:23S rRNA pseudouridine2605 synthase